MAKGNTRPPTPGVQPSAIPSKKFGGESKPPPKD